MAVPPSVKATTVSVELVALCVTVKVAFAGPVSEPFSVPATETVVVSLSAMVRLAVVVSTLMPALPLVIGETSVTVTVSVGSTRASLITGIVIVAVVVLAGIVTECVMAV